MTAITTEDIAAAREQGDLTALLLMAAGLTAKAPAQSTKSEPEHRLPRSRPGAWPDGTRSPGPLPEVARALETAWPGRWKRGAA